MKDETLKRCLKAALLVGGVSALVPLALAPTVSAQGIGVSELEKMLVPTPQSVERGEDLYEQNCAACHGPNGEGMSGVELSGVPGQTFQTSDFTQGNFEYTGGPIQIYNAITFGLDEAAPDAQAAPAEQAAPDAQPEGQAGAQVPPHPKYQYLQYQSRWDIVHYVRSLGPTDQLTDPPSVVAQARERAVEGVCNEDIRVTIADKVAPKGEEQLARGAELYGQQCASCHGDQGAGDGPAAGALQPPPRNLVGTPREDWTNAPSALGVFNTLAVGIEGTSMASYSNLPEDDRWAMTHFVLSLVPEEIEVESGEKEILNACRALSAPDKPAPVSVDVAMQALIKDQVEDRFIRMSKFGPVRLHPDADTQRGQDLYLQNCVSCHGVAGSGNRKGPYGAQPPYLYLEVDRLIPAMAGGTAEQFAERSYSGAHATLPSMSSAALLSKNEWRDLQAYVASFEGQGEITVESPDTGAPATGAPDTGAPDTGAADTAAPGSGTPAPGTPDPETGETQPAPAQGDGPRPPGAGQPDSAQ
jgi:mono/diheme cytochrome c family protein